MKKLIAILITSVPFVASAQNINPVTNLNDVSTKLIDVANIITYFLVALAVIYIVWNVVNFIIKPAGSEGKGAASMGILWGIIGLFIIVSIWGLVNILTNSFTTKAAEQPIPNAGNIPHKGGQPANQVPVFR